MNDPGEVVELTDWRDLAPITIRVDKVSSADGVWFDVEGVELDHDGNPVREVRGRIELIDEGTS